MLQAMQFYQKKKITQNWKSILQNLNSLELITIFFVLCFDNVSKN